MAAKRDLTIKRTTGRDPKEMQALIDRWDGLSKPVAGNKKTQYSFYLSDEAKDRLEQIVFERKRAARGRSPREKVNCSIVVEELIMSVQVETCTGEQSVPRSGSDRG